MSACAHPAVIGSQICTVIPSTTVGCTHLHALVPRTPVSPKCTPCSPQKCTYTRASTPVRRCRNAFDMQTIVTYHATSALPTKPPDSTTANGTATAALSHRHHLIIRLDAGPIQFVYCLHLPLAAAEIILHKILFPPFLWACHRHGHAKWLMVTPIDSIISTEALL